MHASAKATYRHVQGLSRGLTILRALNDCAGCEATPARLSEMTQLDRTTVKRILETLVSEGCVRTYEYDGRYAIATGVLKLSEGMTGDARVVACCAPELKQLGQKTGWSLRITTPRHEQMVIRDSTHSKSVLAIEAGGGLHHALPVLLSAAGRAFFAHSSAAVRQDILEQICSQRSEQTPLANNDKLLDQLTQRVLDDGYAINDGDWGERRLGAVAVPIRGRDGSAVASMSVLYVRQAVERHVVEQEYVPALQRSAASVEAQL